MRSTALQAPAVRVSAARDMIDFIDKFHRGTRRKVLSLLPKESLQIVESSPRTSWLPIEHDHWIVDGIVEVLGFERACQCWSASVLDHVDKPLLRSLVSGVVYGFGDDESRVMGLWPRAWPFLYRDCGSLRLDQKSPRSLEFIFEDLAPEIRAYPNYLISWHGVCRGMARLAQITRPVIWSIAPDLSSAIAKI